MFLLSCLSPKPFFTFLTCFENPTTSVFIAVDTGTRRFEGQLFVQSQYDVMLSTNHGITIGPFHVLVYGTQSIVFLFIE